MSVHENLRSYLKTNPYKDGESPRVCSLVVAEDGKSLIKVGIPLPALQVYQQLFVAWLAEKCHKKYKKDKEKYKETANDADTYDILDDALMTFEHPDGRPVLSITDLPYHKLNDFRYIPESLLKK